MLPRGQVGSIRRVGQVWREVGAKYNSMKRARSSSGQRSDF
jgi:hypothetical protein